MRITATIVVIFGMIGAAQAGPVDAKQASVDSLARTVTLSTVRGAEALVKGQRSGATEVKLVRTKGADAPEKLAYQALTRQKMQLRTGSAKTATLIRVSYPPCANTDTDCSTSTQAR